MSNKKHDPLKALKQAFQKSYDDNELQERFNRFEKDLKSAKETHNKLVPRVNANLHTINTLKESVLQQALCGVLSLEATEKIKTLEAENKELIQKIEFQKEAISKNADLMDKYEDWSDRKLFIWWQAIKAVDPETEPWVEWKDKFDKKIF